MFLICKEKWDTIVFKLFLHFEKKWEVQLFLFFLNIHFQFIFNLFKFCLCIFVIAFSFLVYLVNKKEKSRTFINTMKVLWWKKISNIFKELINQQTEKDTYDCFYEHSFKLVLKYKGLRFSFFLISFFAEAYCF